MADDRLFRLATEAFTINAHHDGRRGWRLVVRARRGDETWDEARTVTYTDLTTRELLDVLEAETNQIL